jgi:hypothetical protein
MLDDSKKDETITMLTVENERLVMDLERLSNEFDLQVNHTPNVQLNIAQNEIIRLKSDYQNVRHELNLKNMNNAEVEMLIAENESLKLELEQTRHEVKILNINHVEGELLRNEIERLKTELEQSRQEMNINNLRHIESELNRNNLETNYLLAHDTHAQYNDTMRRSEKITNKGRNKSNDHGDLSRYGNVQTRDLQIAHGHNYSDQVGHSPYGVTDHEIEKHLNRNARELAEHDRNMPRIHEDYNSEILYYDHENNPKYYELANHNDNASFGTLGRNDGGGYLSNDAEVYGPERRSAKDKSGSISSAILHGN